MSVTDPLLPLATQILLLLVLLKLPLQSSSMLGVELVEPDWVEQFRLPNVFSAVVPLSAAMRMIRPFQLLPGLVTLKVPLPLSQLTLPKFWKPLELSCCRIQLL